MSEQTNPDAPDLKIPVPRGPIPVVPTRSVATVELTVDGHSVTVPEGATLLDACRKAAIETPTLCYLENLTPLNVCRVCVVELEGSRTLVPSCSREAEAGMSVRTDSERVKLSRRMVLEFLGSSTDTSTAPDLQRYINEYDADTERYGDESKQAATVQQPVKIDNDLYIRDYSKCILCYKCVEACGEDAQNTFAISVSGRGFDAEISTEYDVPLTDSACVYCGNCIGVCPTGALMFSSEHQMREDGTWDESKQDQTDTICPYCGVGCTLTVHTQENEIVKVSSPLDQEVTNGHLCIKGRFGWQFVQPKDATPDSEV
jgi:predicted molibdopterin-dependent oxidoreductase YjgC